jgi:hypothetical protein
MEFTEILDEYGVPYATQGNHHCRQGWVQIDCPFCEPDTNKFHMGYNIAYKYTTCYKCGYHDLVSVLSSACKISKPSAFKLVKNLTGKKIAITTASSTKLVLPKNLTTLKKAHIKYLEKRGFNAQELVKIWKIQAIGISAHLSWRIFIPYILKGKTVAWTTRAISTEIKNKYKTAKNEQCLIPIKHLLYGQDYTNKNSVIIHEGPIDVWRTGHGAVAVSGLNYSSTQIKLLSQYKRRIICFDNEITAQKEAIKLCNTLSLFKGETINVCLDSNDAGCATKKEIKKLRSLLL